MTKQPNDSPKVPDRDIEWLLKRASEIDAQGSASLAFQELKDIANEAGITADAVDQAWSELQEKRLVTSGGDQHPAPTGFVARLRARLDTWAGAAALALQTAGIALISFVSGFLTAPADPLRPITSTVVIGLTAAVVLSIASALHHRRNRDQQRFQVHLLVLWLFYWYGTLNGAPSVPDNYFLTIDGLCWAALAVLGGIVVRGTGSSDTNESADFTQAQSSQSA